MKFFTRRKKLKLYAVIAIDSVTRSRHVFESGTFYTLDKAVRKMQEYSARDMRVYGWYRFVYKVEEVR